MMRRLALLCDIREVSKCQSEDMSVTFTEGYYTSARNGSKFGALNISKISE